MDKPFYTATEAAKTFGRPEEEIRDAVRSGLLPGELSHNTGDYLIKAADLSNYLKLGSARKTDAEHYKVLIVDDEVNFANVVKLELERDSRIAVRYASGGRDGLRTAAEFKPDLVFIDFMLPDTSGDEVLQAIRNLRHARTTHVVVYSAHTREAIAQTPDLEARLKSLGADEFMSKAAGLRALVIKVYSILGIQTNTKVVRKPGF